MAEKLCELGDIPDGGAVGTIADMGDRKIAIFAVRQQDEVYVYENACPHLGSPLNFLPDEFLTPDGTQIICSTHEALFNIDDGLCIEGPCEGDHLTSLKSAVRDGVVFIEG